MRGIDIRFMDDREYIRGIINKDPKAYKAVFEKYYSPIVVFVRHQVGETEVAKDIAQDVFLKMLETSHTFTETICLKSWLFTTAHNEVVDYLRHLQVVDKNKFLLAEAMMASQEVDERIDEEVCERVRKAVAALPEQCRAVIQKSIFEGKKYVEIAEELNITINTVRTQILRGYEKLRDMLSDVKDSLVLLLILKRLLERDGRL